MVIVKKIRGMNLWAKLSLITACTLLFTTFMYQGWYGPLSTLAGTVTKTYIFTTTAESWTGNAGISTTDSAVTTGGNPGGAVQSRIAGKNKANPAAGWYLTGVTWESLGVPAGSIVTSVNASYDWRCSENVLGDPLSESGNFVLSDAADGNQTTLVTGTTFSSTTAWATRSATGIAVPSALQASSTSIKLSVLGVLDTTADTTAAVTRMLDNISLTITYSTPAVPVEAAGSLAVTPQSGNYVDSPFTITENFTSTSAVNSCQYTINGGTAWTNGTVSGTGPYTCTASNVSSTNGTGLTIQMRASNTGGASWSTVSASLSKTVDTVAPTDGSLTATAASSSQINLNWTAASDTGSGLNTTTAYKVVRADATTTPPVDCSGTAIYQGTANSYNDSTGLTASTDYAYKVCAYDALNNVSAGATATATTQAGGTCTANTPSLAVSPPSSLVSTGANMLYTVTVTNNDSGAGCGNVTYNLALANSNTTDFSTTALSSTSLSIAAGNQGTATFTVTAGAAAPDGAINTSTVSASASGHTAPPNATAVTTVNSGNSPLMHTSANLDPTNAKGYGVWGATFTCNTCHSSESGNVKLVSDGIATSIGSRPVVFSRMTASVANTQGTFGDDLRTTYANASRNVCEVCHHQTIYHQYSSTKIADRSTNPHYNRKDCISCHPHNAGFKGAGCDGCHGNPPNSTATLVTSPEATLALGSPPTSGGSHAAHVTSEGMKCTTCHSGNTMPSVSKTIQLGFDINNTNWPGFAGTAAFGSFSGHSPLGGSPAYTFVSSKGGTVVNTSTSYRTSCNVYCHGQWSGANGSINPSWIITDGSQSACGTCHAATASVPPQTGKHLTHASSSAGNYGFSCTKCHPNTSGFNHVNGAVQWRLSSSTTGLIGSTATYTPGSGTAGISGQTNTIAPSATYGTCTNIYCHSNAQASNGTSSPIAYTSPKWSDAALGCGGCHLDMDSSASATGDHVMHAQTNAISCATCHSGYTETSVNTATHVNKTIELTFSGNATGTTYSQANQAAGNGYGTCSTSYCHSTGQSSTGGATPTYPTTPPTWGTTVTDCGSCHVNMDSNAAATGNHVKHAQGTANFSCATCHNGYTETSVNAATHVNKTIELSFSGTYATGTVYSQGNGAVGLGYGNCSASKCHGQGAPVWNGALYSATVQCENCHGSAASTAFYSTAATGAAPTKVTSATDAKVGAHDIHLKSATTGLSANIACTECHATVTTITNPTSHMNGTTTFVWGTLAKTGGLTPAYNSPTAGKCANVYCHGAAMPAGDALGSNRTPLWTDTAYVSATLDAATCGRCHGFPPSSASGHPAATAPTSFPTANCNCHGNMSTTASTFATIFTDKALHINGVFEPAASGCKGCHGTGSAKDMQTEFAKNSHHINKAWADITDADCVVCHAEGTISGGSVSVVANKHGNDTGTKGVVDLYNADTRTTIYAITVASLTAKTAAGNTANATLDTFCFSCHDSNGAAALTTGNGFSGAAAANVPTNPFSEVGTAQRANAYDLVQKSFGAAPAALNVYDAFATTNNNNHAVRAARYTTATLSTPYSSLKQAGLLSTSVQVFSGQGVAGVADNSQLHCNDCHSTGYSAHGSANEYLLQTATEENPTTEHLAMTSYVCQKCHSSTTYTTTTGNHGPANSSDYQPQSNTTAVGASARIANTAKGKGHATGIACLNCHDGDVGFGGIHGFPNATYTDGDAHTTNKRRFMPGSGLYKYSPSKTTAGDGGWDMATPDNQCYTIGTTTSMSGCTQHSGGTSAGSRNVRRPVNY